MLGPLSEHQSKHEQKDGDHFGTAWNQGSGLIAAPGWWWKQPEKYTWQTWEQIKLSSIFLMWLQD